MIDQSEPIKRLREFALSLPEAHEVEAWGTPTFRVRGKMFAVVSTRASESDVWLKAAPGAQAHLTTADPERFFVPPYFGPKGWLGVHLVGADQSEVEELVRRAYRLIAPRKLVAVLDDG